MSPHTAAALRQAAYNLRDEASRAERQAQHLHDEADAHLARAAGLREAAGLMDTAVDESTPAADATTHRTGRQER